jgi:cellobiose-specific phosphotransferase system component IIA
MPITTLPYRTYIALANGFKAKGRPRKKWRDGIKDALQQNGLTINDATRQARARILKAHRHQISRVQKPSPSPVKELVTKDDLMVNFLFVFLLLFLIQRIW